MTADESEGLLPRQGPGLFASALHRHRSRAAAQRRRQDRPRHHPGEACRRLWRQRRQGVTAAMPADLNSVTSLITAEHAKALMIELVRVPSPLTEKLEAEPKLREFIDIAVEPRLREMGLTDIRRDGMGNLLATLGPRRERPLAHARHQRDDPARRDHAQSLRRRGARRRALRPAGRGGARQGLERTEGAARCDPAGASIHRRGRVPLSGQVLFLCCVSGETGRHDAIKSIIEATGARAEMAVLNGTGNRISLGNRGRVDVTIVVHGSPGHSSRPASACNAVTGALEVIRRLVRRAQIHRFASGAWNADAGGQPHPELSGVDPHHSGPLRDRRRSPADARRGPRRGGGRDRCDRQDRGRRERSSERQAVARGGREGAVHVPFARHRCHPRSWLR